jgi:hypothetical protein
MASRVRRNQNNKDKLREYPVNTQNKQSDGTIASYHRIVAVTCWLVQYLDNDKGVILARDRI